MSSGKQQARVPIPITEFPDYNFKVVMPCVVVVQWCGQFLVNFLWAVGSADWPEGDEPKTP